MKLSFMMPITSAHRCLVVAFFKGKKHPFYIESSLFSNTATGKNLNMQNFVEEHSKWYNQDDEMLEHFT